MRPSQHDIVLPTAPLPLPLTGTPSAPPLLCSKVVLTEKPQNLLTGDLGVTYVPS